MASEMNPYVLPSIGFIAGSSQELYFHVYYYNETNPFDLSSCTADFAIVDYLNKTGDPLLTKTATVKGSGEANTIVVSLTPTDTKNLFGKYIYQIQIKHSSGRVDIPHQGFLYVTNNIHKSFL